MADRTHARVMPALAVLLLGLLITAVLALQQLADNQDRVNQALQRRADEVATRLGVQLNRYEYGLRGARGAIVALGDAGLSRERFARYQRTRNIPLEFPGAHGFGFIRLVSADQLATFTRQARADGAPDFAVRQLQPHSGPQYIIQYIEPVLGNEQALGLDVASEPHRRQAADQAAQSGEAQLTAPLTLVQASGLARQGFLLLLPIYRPDVPTDTPAQRAAALLGWSYAPLVLQEVLAQFDFGRDFFDLELLDVAAGQPPEPFYSSATGAAESGPAALAERAWYGRTWRLRLLAKPAFVTDLRLTHPALVAVLGSLATAMLAALVLMRQLGRQRQRHVQAAQEMLVTFVENASDAIISESLDGRVTGWNRAAEQIFGWSAREAIGQPLVDLIGTPEHAQETRLVLQRAASGEVLHPFDSVRRKRDGSLVDVSIAASAITDAQGRVIGVGKSLRDISSRRAHERGLQEFNQVLERQVGERTRQLEAARRHLKTTLDALPSMVGYWDRQLVNRFANRAYHDWFGVDPDSLPGRSMDELLGPELMARNRPYIDGVLAGHWQTFERAIPGPGGVVRHSLAHYLPDVEDGQVKGFYALVHDVTELMHNRLRLADSEAVLNRTGAVAHIGGWQYDLVSGRLTWTQQTRVIHEVPDDYQPSLETALDFFPPDDRRRVERAIERARTGGTPWDLELQLITALGHTRWVRAQGELERGPAAQGSPPLRLVGSIQDISDRREADQALQRVQAAEAANAAKSAFLANVSHEMRTPLNAVIGFAHILSQGVLSADQRHLLARIHGAGRHLLGVINDVLDLSKIEAGQMTLSATRFSLHGLLHEVADMLRPAALDKHLTLLVQVAPDLPPFCLGDDVRVRQVLTNLLANAIKFTEAGQVCLAAAVHTGPSGQAGVRLMVKDTGIGISPEAQQRLFEPFNQADAATNRRFGGTGLGLSIVRHLALLMGGQVGLHSVPGQGSSFWVDLPLPPAEPADDAGNVAALPAPAPPPHAAGLARLPGVRLMVIDDSELNLEVAQRILEAEGAVVQVASQAQQGLDRLFAQPEQFELVVMDVQMPGLDGLEATRRIRAHPATQAMPVVAVTAGALVSDRSGALAAGLNAFVSKPFHPDALVLTVRDEVARSRGQAILPRARQHQSGAAERPWPPLPGIDMDQARALLVGDWPAFVRLLGHLLDQPLPSWPHAEPPAGDELATLRQQVHRLLGSAGMLGAVALQSACRRLQAVLDDLPAQAGELAEALKQLPASLAPLRLQWPALQAAPPDPAAPATLAAAQTVRPQDLARLRSLLQAQDLAALALYRQLAPSLALPAAERQALDQAMSRLDFAAALLSLREQ